MKKIMLEKGLMKIREKGLMKIQEKDKIEKVLRKGLKKNHQSTPQ